VAASAGTQRTINSLRRRGLIQLAGFTPSDAAHVLNMQSNWSREAAMLAAQLMTRLKDMKAPTPQRVQEFVEAVWSEVVHSSSRAILQAASGLTNDGRFLDAVCRGKNVIGLTTVSMSPTLPIVAVGAPVKVYYGEVGRRLKAEVVFTEHCEVANAVGAASGVIARSAIVQVIGDGGGVFRVHGPQGTVSFAGAREAIEKAGELAEQAARTAATSMGADDLEVRLAVAKHMFPGAVDENGLFTATVTAEAIGRPRLGAKT
jgi:N-methylhydantoinase A/oxoprolinase/acetone carboxylase beta subunit